MADNYSHVVEPSVRADIIETTAVICVTIPSAQQNNHTVLLVLFVEIDFCEYRLTYCRSIQYSL
jgi:hypothetical protein